MMTFLATKGDWNNKWQNGHLRVAQRYARRLPQRRQIQTLCHLPGG
ncbi:MAG: hypothetical protein LBR06_04100 [Bacteroidales bacterium]|nr:hypothetical protein [Bacteroidales bacterium]